MKTGVMRARLTRARAMATWIAWSRALLIAASLLPPAAALAQPATSPPKATEAPPPSLEPDALAVLRGMSEKLAAAKTLEFTALATYESPAANGQPLYYMLRSEVLLERPDKLAVITPGDGPPSELYYDGKTVVMYNPELNAAATADAPPRVDAMLKMLNTTSGTYYPFADIIAADPYKDITDGLKSAFVVGRSHAYGDTETIMLALASDTVQAEVWVDTASRLPLMIRAVFPNDPEHRRFQVELSHWRLDAPIKPGSFTSDRARNAPRIQFARPDVDPATTR